jgi:RNA polymerase sigma-70 factor (ECF subfamily)
VTDPALQLLEPMRDIDETSLLERARAGESEAIDALVRAYLGDVYAVTVRVLGERDLAQDAAQDAMVNALRSLDRFRGDSSFRTWLLRIAVNAARSVARRRTRRREVSIDVVEGHSSNGVDPASHAVTHDEASRAAGMLARLPEKQRMAVSLRVQQGLSYHEIATVMGCTAGAARVNYHLGVKRLRELMK